ncbi:uncharacterized protein LOC131073093 isoform X2 [Cryptomeria japonica]|uniref:uncharacterized protein LOC131073093 isoform X2 n=1 Tax=Cryptomeria japonica TaxID=3369 RepID=UPI0025ABE8CE|nr:uncharacterized protein LOC131073093 isoform X2 [Cryptomeria japonica]
MASTAGLVPITRDFLAKFYDKYVFSDLPEDVARLSTQLRQCCNSLLSQSPKKPGEELMVSEMECNPPHKIDENLWKNREYIEEILFLLDKAHWPKKAPEDPADMAIVTAIQRLDTEVKNLLKSLQSFQSENNERIFKMIVTYMPQDFRGTLLKQQRERSERKQQAEVEAVISSGGSIRDKYGLLWKQQMDRRRQLAQLGSATGVYKTIVKYLVGVPEVLLDFVRKVNDHNGPMEEQRLRYGPPLYQLTSMAFGIQFFLKLWWRYFDECELPKDDLLSLLEQSIKVYSSEFKRFLTFIGNVFENSPFLISAEEAGAIEPNRYDDFKETTIPAGKAHEVLLALDTVNSYIAWDFKLTSGKDVGFCVELIGQSGQSTAMFPYKRCESDQGNFCTPKAGTYRLVWDNSYSTFYKKVLKYKVDAFPPVIETTQLDVPNEGNE